MKAIVRFSAAALLVTAVCSTAVGPIVAQEPSARPKALLALPAEIRGGAGTFVVVRADTDGKEVKFHAITSGLSVFPSDLLTDKKATVVVAAKAGSYKLIAVACVDGKLSDFAETMVVIGNGSQPPPPDTNGHKPPPVDPPSKSKLYFVVVRPDGPAPPDFAAYMGNTGWKELIQKGHMVKDKTVAEAAALGIRIPDGTVIPCVITLRVAADGASSTIVRGAIPLPTPADIVKLPEGIK